MLDRNLFYDHGMIGVREQDLEPAGVQSYCH